MESDDRPNLHEAADRATKVTIFDRFMSATIDTVGIALPYGAVLAAILRQVVPNDHLEYLNDVLHDVVDRIEEFDEAKVDRAYFQTDAWMNDVRRVVESQGSQRNREKREHFVAALANSATIDRPKDAIRLRYFDVLESLRPSHLELLAVVMTARDNPVGGSFDEYLTTRLPDQDLENPEQSVHVDSPCVT